MTRESIDGGRITGGILRARLDRLAQHPIPGGLEGLRPRLSEETRQVLDGPILPISWYPFRALVELDRAIAEAMGGDQREAVIELGRQSARLNLATSYRHFRRDHPHEFFENSARLHNKYLDFGREEYERTSDTSCRLSIVDSPWFSKIFCWSALGYYEEVVRLQGGTDPKVEETECACDGAPACHFTIGWS